MNVNRWLAVACVLIGTSTSHAFQLNSRWTDTATNPVTTTQGAPMTITWGFINDGTTTSPNPGAGGSGAASNLISVLDTTFGAGPGGVDFTQRPWFTHFEQIFFRWGELCGLSYVYEPNDDGVAQTGGQLGMGILGQRADVRIGGRTIDGPSNVLAFNNFPNYADMVIDTADSGLFDNPANDYRFLRDLGMHEHGHGMGLNHVVSSSRRFLMEPFIDTSFDGPQLDDILGAQRHYGDFYEKSNGGTGNDTEVNATSLGTIASGTTASIGTSGALVTLIPRTAHDFISIDDNSDIDYLSFTVTEASTVDVTLRPVGLTYFQGPQGGSQTQLVTSQLSDLTLALFDTDGSTQLDLQNVNGLGGMESILGLSLPSAGTYYTRITGAHNNIQLYQLDVTVMSAFLAGDFNMDGLFDCADIDSLVGEVALGTHTASFDLTGDGLVDTADVTEWLSLAGAANLASGNPYLPGDANLDGSVDGSDFNIWNSNKFTAVAAWCSGDFSADGSVDGSDFNIWNSNKFNSSDGISVVPEPVIGYCLTCWGLLAAACRIRSSRWR